MDFFNELGKFLINHVEREYNRMERERERRNPNKDKDVMDIVYDEDEQILNKNYRRTAFENHSSNNGWYTCPKCGRKFRASNMEADHIMPKSMGGTNAARNLQLLCSHCNKSKQNKTDDTYSDLQRRDKELKKQYKEDQEFLKETREILEKEKQEKKEHHSHYKHHKHHKHR